MGKLILQRSDGQGARIKLEDGRLIHVMLIDRDGKTKLAFEAPPSIVILRDEVEDRSLPPPRPLSSRVVRRATA